MNWKEDNDEKAKRIIEAHPLNELYWLLGRFCGPNNRIICQAKFGCILPEKMVYEEIQTRETEKFLLGVD